MSIMPATAVEATPTESFTDELLEAVAFANDADRLLPPSPSSVDALLARLRDDNLARVARLCPQTIWTVEDGPAEVEDVEPVNTLDESWFFGLTLGLEALGHAKAPCDMDADHKAAFEAGLAEGLDSLLRETPEFDDYGPDYPTWLDTITPAWGANRLD